jgi:hypothetical protein
MQVACTYAYSLKTLVNACTALVQLLSIFMYTGKLIKNTSHLTENNKGYHRLKIAVINTAHMKVICLLTSMV